MRVESKSFVADLSESKKPELEYIHSGAQTSAYKIQSLSGDFVLKVPKYAHSPKWSIKIRRAKRCSDNVRKTFNNDKYFIPKTFISNGDVYEQFVPGIMAKDFNFRDMCSKEKKLYAFSMANFINDMSDMAAIKTHENDERYQILQGAVANFIYSDLLDDFSDYILPENKNFLIELYDFLANCPENKTKILMHNDLNYANVFIDEKNKKVGIIDFEYIEYVSQIHLMYSDFAPSKTFWDTVDSLPRKTNSEFKWEFDMDKKRLYRYTINLSNSMNKFYDNYQNIYDSYKPARDELINVNENCKKLKPIFARLKIKEKLKQMQNKSKQLCLPEKIKCK